MAKEGLDALFVTERWNRLYLSGFQTQLVEMSNYDTPFFVIMPIEGEPVMVGVDYTEDVLKRDSCIRDIRTYERWFGIRDTVKVLHDMGLDRGKIGAEFGFGQRLGISHNDFERLEKGLPNAKFVDGTDVFWKLRVIKSEKEIEYIRKACEITSKAYEKFFQALKERTTEKEITMLMASCMRDAGANEWRIQPDYRMPIIYPGGTYLSEPSDRALRKGDLLWMDNCVTYKSYRSDFSRMAVVGRPTERQKKAHELVRRLTKDCIDALYRVGTKASEIYNWIAEYKKTRWVEEGYREHVEGHPGMQGHSLGLDVMEPPFLSPPYAGSLSDAILEENMVVTCEPGTLTPFGYFALEEDILITKKGCEILTKAPPELHTI
jgi:Xaa-Pro aminopeptidase